MSVSRVTADGDWTFGRSLNDYITGSDEIAQNVVTRLRFFQQDWFLDVQAGIDWFTILGSKSNEQVIRAEISRVTLNTQGVTEVNTIEFVVNREQRTLTVNLTYTDIYRTLQDLTFEVTTNA